MPRFWTLRAIVHTAGIGGRHSHRRRLLEHAVCRHPFRRYHAMAALPAGHGIGRATSRADRVAAVAARACARRECRGRGHGRGGAITRASAMAARRHAGVERDPGGRYRARTPRAGRDWQYLPRLLSISQRSILPPVANPRLQSVYGLMCAHPRAVWRHDGCARFPACYPRCDKNIFCMDTARPRLPAHLAVFWSVVRSLANGICEEWLFGFGIRRRVRDSGSSA